MAWGIGILLTSLAIDTSFKEAIALASPFTFTWGKGAAAGLFVIHPPLSFDCCLPLGKAAGLSAFSRLVAKYTLAIGLVFGAGVGTFFLFRLKLLLIL